MEKEKKEYGKLQWFFFVILIPIIFTLTLVIVILSVAGFDVFGKTKMALAEIPVVEKLFKDEEKETKDTSGKDVSEAATDNEAKAEKLKLEQKIDEQDIEIDALEKDLSLKEKEVQNLNQEVKSLEEQLESLDNVEPEKKSRDIAKLYDNMSSKKAAEIIPNLKEAEAMLILTSLDDKQVADILTKMSVEDAVKYTNLIATDSETE